MNKLVTGCRSLQKTIASKTGSVGEATHKMVAYKPSNHSGVSIHAGALYYDNNPCTLQILHKYGAVCGGVSKFGTGRWVFKYPSGC